MGAEDRDRGWGSSAQLLAPPKKSPKGSQKQGTAKPPHDTGASGEPQESWGGGQRALSPNKGDLSQNEGELSPQMRMTSQDQREVPE